MFPPRGGGAGEHGFGQGVHVELVHLRGELHLKIGIEPEVEQPLGRLAGALGIAGDHGQVQGHQLAPLHRLLIRRLDRFDERQGLVGLVALGPDLGQLELWLGVVLGLLRGGGEHAHRLVLLVIPPAQVSQRQQPLDPFGRLRRLGAGLRVGEQIAEHVVALEELERRPEHGQGRCVQLAVGSREVDLDVAVVLPGLDLHTEPAALSLRPRGSPGAARRRGRGRHTRQRNHRAISARRRGPSYQRGPSSSPVACGSSRPVTPGPRGSPCSP